jgi:hypothetical protein
VDIMDDNATQACLDLANDFQLNWDVLVYYGMFFVTFTLILYSFRKIKEQIK